ncbi:uncharacterized protein VTP21DRAFT_8109 [Calcarisporiella thermophila]|uniref:uncharacterized protein n=1 Tax=Calcarisporiella thermophila TaxID=911321 RepID=UPI0037439B8E
MLLSQSLRPTLNLRHIRHVRWASVLHGVDPENVLTNSFYGDAIRQQVYRPPSPPVSQTADRESSSPSADGERALPSKTTMPIESAPMSPAPVKSNTTPSRAKITLGELSRVLETSKKLAHYLKQQAESEFTKTSPVAAAAQEEKTLGKEELEGMLRQHREEIVQELLKELKKKKN